MIQGEENRWVLREALKLEKVGCWRTERGSLFQEVGPETGKAEGVEFGTWWSTKSEGVRGRSEGARGCVDV